MNFDSPKIANGTRLSDQYQSAYGVTFTTGQPMGATGLPVLEQVSSDNDGGCCVADISQSASEAALPSMAGVFSTSRRTVSVYVRNVTSGSFTAHLTLEGFNSSNQRVAASNNDQPTLVSSSGSPWVLLTMSSAAEDITQFRITGDQSYDQGQQIQIDDLSYDDPMITPPPAFSIGTPSPGPYTLTRGGSLEIPISINRINNSTGGIALAAASLPFGVSAQFSPNPATGTSATLTLQAQPDSGTWSGTFTVTGTPTSSSAGSSPSSISLALNVVRAFTLSQPPTTALAPCSSTAVPITVTRGPGFTSPLSLSIENWNSTSGRLPAGLTASFSPAVLSGETDTSTLTLTRADNAADPNLELVVRAQDASGDFAEVSFEAPQTGPTVSGVSVASRSDLSVSAPLALQPAGNVFVYGAGVCPGAMAVVGYPADAATAAADTAAPAAAVLTQLHEGEWTFPVPRLAASGPVTIVNPGGTSGSSPQSLNVLSYRDTDGFNFANRPWGGGDFYDWHELFGNQLYLSLNPCGVLGDCEVGLPVPRPDVLTYIAIAGAALHNAGGTCFGFAVASRRLAGGQVPISDFTSSARTVWQLPDTTPLDHYLNVQFLLQQSANFIHSYLGQILAAEAGARSGADIRRDLVTDLSKGYRPLVTLYYNGNGHAINAYDVEDDPHHPGTFFIRVYDNNVPYTSAEATDYRTHRAAEQNSRIEVGPYGHWYFPNLNWYGGPDTITVTPVETIPLQPLFPDTLGGVRVMLFGAGSATPAPTSNAPRRKARIVPLPVFAPGPHPQPGYIADSSSTAEMALVASRNGEQQAAFAGGGSTGTLSASGAPGAHGSLALPANAIGWTYSSVGRERLAGSLFERSAVGSIHGVEISGSNERGSEGLRFGSRAESLVVSRVGAATTVTLRLSSYGAGNLPQRFDSGPVTIMSGDQLQLRPVWNALGSRLHATVSGPHPRNLTLVNHNRDGIRGLHVAAHRTGRRISTVISLRIAGKATGERVALAVVLLAARRPVAREVLAVPARIALRRALTILLPTATPQRARLRLLLTAIAVMGGPNPSVSSRQLSIAVGPQLSSRRISGRR